MLDIILIAFLFIALICAIYGAAKNIIQLLGIAIIMVNIVLIIQLIVHIIK